MPALTPRRCQLPRVECGSNPYSFRWPEIMACEPLMKATVRCLTRLTRLSAPQDRWYRIARGLGRSSRLRWVLGAGSVLVFLVTRPLLAADISGTWEISSQMARGRQTIVLELVQDGSRVSGTGTMRIDGGGEAVRVEVRSGTARGGDFRFLLVEDGGPVSRPQEFVGNWYKDEMSGRTDGAFGSRMFAGARQPVPN